MKDLLLWFWKAEYRVGKPSIAYNNQIERGIQFSSNV